MPRSLLWYAKMGLFATMALSIACGDDDDDSDGVADLGRDMTMADMPPLPDGSTDMDIDMDRPDIPNPPNCDNVPFPCETEGRSCDGDILVSCRRDTNGCLIESRAACSAVPNGVCDETGPRPACAVPECAGRDLCDERGRTCQGDTLVLCDFDGAGCLVRQEFPCADAVANGVCNPLGSPPFCRADPCVGVADTCAAEGVSCNGDTLVVCAENAFGCLVESQTDCTTESGTCEDMACMAAIDCAARPNACATQGLTCDGQTLVRCAPDPFGCLVETRDVCDDVPMGVCSTEGGAPACATDPCAGVNECTPSRMCMSRDSLVVCEPDARGCFIETTTPCDGANGECVLSPSPRCVGDRCGAATNTGVILSCGSGTVMGNTAMGTRDFDRYSCNMGVAYARAEQIYRFQQAGLARVTITATRLSGTGNYDLFALDGESALTCDPGLTCLDSSTGTTATETITFDYIPGTTAYVAYDQAGLDEMVGPTTTYSLTVTCEVPTCGNGTMEAAEECDDGNATAGDGCSNVCQVEPGFTCTGGSCTMTCGNGTVEAAAQESCDDGNSVGGDGCSASCAIEPGFACSGTPSNCTFACGNGTVDPPFETCDDGNARSFDGCSRICRIEAGFRCTGAPSTCSFVCGNGVVDEDVNEQCDDGNVAGGDGCTGACRVEQGYICEGMPSMCQVACGNGVIDTSEGELCDDMNTANGDGCNEFCEVETGFTCTGMPSVCSQ